MKYVILIKTGQKKNKGKLKEKGKFTRFIVNGGTVTKAVLDI